MYALISYKIRILTPDSTCGMAVTVQSKMKAHDTRTFGMTGTCCSFSQACLLGQGKKTDTPILCSSSFTTVVFVESVVSLKCILYIALYM